MRFAIRSALAAVPGLLLASAVAGAQRSPSSSLPAFETHGTLAVDTGAVRITTGWSALSPAQRRTRRALWATGGGAAGLVVGAGAGILLAMSDDNPANDEDALGIIILGAAGESLGVTLGAAVPGGPGRGWCRGDVRLLRSLVGAAAGTAAVLLAFHTENATSAILVPPAQILGSVAALGGC